MSFRSHYELLVTKAYRTLGLLRRTFSNSHTIKAKKALYISLVRSQLTYSSQVWRPHLIKDIELLEGIQRPATKYILNDYTSDYKTRLETLGLLPLTYVFKLNDLMLCVRSMKSPTSDFNIQEYVSFSDHNTRSATAGKMTHTALHPTIDRGTSSSQDTQSMEHGPYQ